MAPREDVTAPQYSAEQLLTSIGHPERSAEVTEHMTHPTPEMIELGKQVVQRTEEPPPPHLGPTGDMLACVQPGTHYGIPCPVRWSHHRGITGNVCKAPDGYEPLSSCPDEFSADGMSKADKIELENRCLVRWPCIGEAVDGKVPDYSRVCPDEWELNEKGFCVAPRWYGGSCAREAFLWGYTENMKKEFAVSCMVTWPLAPLPTGVPKPSEKPKTSPLPGTRCGNADFAWCPDRWKLNPDSYMCEAPVYPPYLGPCPKELDTTRLKPAMKEALEKHCNLHFSCEPIGTIPRTVTSPQVQVAVAGVDFGSSSLPWRAALLGTVAAFLGITPLQPPAGSSLKSVGSASRQPTSAANFI